MVGRSLGRTITFGVGRRISFYSCRGISFGGREDSVVVFHLVDVERFHLVVGKIGQKDFIWWVKRDFIL